VLTWGGKNHNFHLAADAQNEKRHGAERPHGKKSYRVLILPLDFETRGANICSRRQDKATRSLKLRIGENKGFCGARMTPIIRKAIPEYPKNRPVNCKISGFNL